MCLYQGVGLVDCIFDISGKTALVTGASSGLGRHFAITFASKGAKVILAARGEEKLKEVTTHIDSNGGQASIAVTDVTDANSVRRAFDTAEATFGVPTIVVNNSGIAGSGLALELDEHIWDEVIDTNLRGAWLVAQQAAQRMVAAQVAGTIINIASIAGLRVATAMAAYSASKAGLIRLTEALAMEWARHRIRVNAIAPGYILTPLNREFFDSPAGQKMISRIPQKHLGEPKDLDGTLLLLASDASRYMTGTTIVIDGGHSVSSL